MNQRLQEEEDQRQLKTIRTITEEGEEKRPGSDATRGRSLQNKTC